MKFLRFSPLLAQIALIPTALAQKIYCGGAGALAGCPDVNPQGQGEILGVGQFFGEHIIANVISLVIGLLAFVAMGYLIKGGIDFIRAQGSSDKIKTAQKSMIAAAVGLVIAMSAFILVQIVANISVAP